MAVFPVPVGLSAMMSEIAGGIAAAGRVLPEASRSDVGALAVHRASVEVNFELSAMARTESGAVGLGARTFLFGPGAETGSNEQTARNTGRITLEIVAITEPERNARPKPKPKPDPDAEPEPVAPPAMGPDPDADREAERLRRSLAAMREALPALEISEADRKQVAALLDMATAALAAGNLGAARDIITQLAPGFAALGRDAGRAPER